MDLTPGEKAVLRQIGALYATEAGRDHQLKTLLMQWPPTHREAYKQAYLALLSKLLIVPIGAQYFRITEAGLSTLGIAPSKAPQQAPLPRAQEKRSPPRAHVRPAPKPPSSALSRFARLFGRSG